MALYSYGLHSYGVYSYGMYSCIVACIVACIVTAYMITAYIRARTYLPVTVAYGTCTMHVLARYHMAPNTDCDP